MVGVTLSRWTMSYFVVALLCLLAALALMALGYGYPNAALRAPETLIVVHVVVIGWLSLLICGALFQFAPVLVAQPLHSNTLPLPTLVALVAGLALLALGFLQLAEQIEPGLPLLTLGGALLGLGFALVLWNLGRTLHAARTRPLPARFVVVGLLCLAATAGLGFVFALVLGGTAPGSTLAALTAKGLSLHAIAGLGGWLTFTAIGVTYRLLAMFMLAPELDRLGTKAALHLGAGALAVAIVGGVAVIVLGAGLTPVLLAAGGLGLVALLLYGADMVHLYRVRKRPAIELNSRMAAFALGALGASVALIAVLVALGRLADHSGAVVFLVAMGWLSGLGLAQLYKIVAFLTWLEVYGPVLGKAQTPRVQDLVVEARASRWFHLYFFAVLAGTAALLVGAAQIFQASATAMLVATGGIAAELVRTRRLANVPAALRLPQGAVRPGWLSCRAPQP